MNKKHIPKYILAYYFYETIYVVFWTIIDVVLKQDLILTYIATTIIAGGWMAYMMFRAFVKNDKDVNLLVVIANIIVLFVLSTQ